FEDVLDELEKQGLIQRNRSESPGDAWSLTARGDRAVRESVFERVFKGLGKGFKGSHATGRTGQGGERLPETRPWAFGDDAADLDFRATFRNSLQRHGEEGSPLDGGVAEEDFEVYEREQLSSCSTVLMLDISHSMILYGEDRITPAKMVAMSLVEFVRRRYPRDTIDVITFGDEAEEIPADRIASVSVGPFHTNTCDGLRLAQN